MDYPPFDLEEFVKGLTLPGCIRVLSTEQEKNTGNEIIPGLISATVEGQFANQRVSGFASPQTLKITMRVFVSWTPELGTLRFTVAIGTDIESLIANPEDRWDAAVNAVNKLNHKDEGGISTALTFVDEDDDLVILMQQTNILPRELFDSVEGLAALKIMLGVNLARFFGDVYSGQKDLEGDIKEYAGEPLQEIKIRETMH